MVNAMLYVTLALQLDKAGKNRLLIDLNNGTYEQVEQLMISKLIHNLDIKQLYTDCTKEYLSSTNDCIRCKFYKSDICACVNPAMEQEYGTPFYIPDNIKFSCGLIEPIRNSHG